MILLHMSDSVVCWNAVYKLSLLTVVTVCHFEHSRTVLGNGKNEHYSYHVLLAASFTPAAVLNVAGTIHQLVPDRPIEGADHANCSWILIHIRACGLSLDSRARIQL